LKIILKPIVLVALTVAFMLFVDCSATLVGLGAGMVIDESSKKQNQIAIGGVLGLEPGTKMTISLINGAKVTGKYCGFAGDEIQSDSSNQSHLPAYNESITIIDTLDASGTFIFRAFYYHKQGEEWIPQLAVININSQTDTIINLYSVREIYSDKNTISREIIIRSFSGQSIPNNSKILIHDSLAVSAIPLKEIASVELPAEHHAARNGFIIGLFVDICFVLLLINGLRNWPED
jgi:hypothetical protein